MAGPLSARHRRRASRHADRSIAARRPGDAAAGAHKRALSAGFGARDCSDRIAAIAAIARSARRPARDRRAACLASRRRGSRPARARSRRAGTLHLRRAAASAPARRGRPATPRFVTRFVARFSTRKQPLSARRTCLVDTAFTPHSRRIHAETRPARR
ncbi:amino acid permease [Burkholderia pseudomallei]|nr:amino acid permease [Burkholderia pseudomallei]OMQ77127.1 amino acid permease [Burkholderia pseudomallei]OMQ78375.1 amino acid permease [Burkholderia pseudomallei]